MPTTEPLRLAVIVGSNREGRFGRTVADWFVTQVCERSDMVPDLLDVAELQAMTVREAVSFHGMYAGGLPLDPTACGSAARTMLDQLAWWGRVLRAPATHRSGRLPRKLRALG